MHLRPFLLISMCLLSACEKKDAAPGSHAPDIANTKASLRDGERGSRPTDRRRRPGGPLDPIKVLDALIHGRSSDDTILYQATIAIKEADPSQFDAIWRKLGEGDNYLGRSSLHLLAIYHLAARGDLSVAKENLRELMLPHVPESTHAGLLRSLFSMSDPAPTEIIGYVRENEPEANRDDLEYLFRGEIDPARLLAFGTGNYRLSPDETAMVMKE